MTAIELATRSWGEGARTLLWVHGYAMDSSVWGSIWSLLPEYRHVGVDLPGHGASARVPVPGVEAAAEAVLAVAQRVGARDLVAMSFGGLVGLQAAMQAKPGALATLTLASPALGGGPQDSASLECNLELIRMASERGLGPWLCERWMASPPRIFEGAARSPELFAALREVVLRHPFGEVLTGSMRPLMSHAHGPRELARIDAATRVLVGEEDMDAFKRGAELIRRGVKGCARRYVPGAGHLCLLERPEEGARQVRAFLGEHPSGRT